MLVISMLVICDTDVRKVRLMFIKSEMNVIDVRQKFNLKSRIYI